MFCMFMEMKLYDLDLLKIKVTFGCASGMVSGNLPQVCRLLVNPVVCYFTRAEIKMLGRGSSAVSV